MMCVSLCVSVVRHCVSRIRSRSIAFPLSCIEGLAFVDISSKEHVYSYFVQNIFGHVQITNRCDIYIYIYI